MKNLKNFIPLLIVLLNIQVALALEPADITPEYQDKLIFQSVKGKGCEAPSQSGFQFNFSYDKETDDIIARTSAGEVAFIKNANNKYTNSEELIDGNGYVYNLTINSDDQSLKATLEEVFTTQHRRCIWKWKSAKN